SGGAQAAGGGRRAAAAVHAAGDGCLAASGARSLCRSVQEQCRLQEGLGGDACLPQRPKSVVAGRRADLRQRSRSQTQPHLIAVARTHPSASVAIVPEMALYVSFSPVYKYCILAPVSGVEKTHKQTGRSTMKRREFLKAAGVGLATSTIAAPAIAQSMPELKWRVAANPPKARDTLLGAGAKPSPRVAPLTEKKLPIHGVAAGRIVP